MITEASGKTYHIVCFSPLFQSVFQKLPIPRFTKPRLSTTIRFLLFSLITFHLIVFILTSAYGFVKGISLFSGTADCIIKLNT